MQSHWKPTRAEIAAAHGNTVPDVIAHDLRVLFCGINPGLYSAAVRHHFARPGNRFWPTLHRAGFTERVLSPFEERELLSLGYGITNIVNRASATADQLTAQELVRGVPKLKKKLVLFRPRFVAFLGVTAYRTAFNRPQAVVGRQSDRLAKSAVWILPNPSGLNAHYQIDDLVAVFSELRIASEHSSRSGRDE